MTRLATASIFFSGSPQKFGFPSLGLPRFFFACRSFFFRAYARAPKSQRKKERRIPKTGFSAGKKGVSPRKKRKGKKKKGRRTPKKKGIPILQTPKPIQKIRKKKVPKKTPEKK
jgi:hypothetical protein